MMADGLSRPTVGNLTTPGWGVVPESFHDGELVVRAAGGDHEAGAELFRRYHNRLLRRMGHWTWDRLAAEDLAQDAWVKAIGALDRFEPGAPFWPWLRCIADNTARSALRRQLTPGGTHRTVAVEHEVLRETADPVDSHARIDDSAVLVGALNGIPARQRDAFLAVAHVGMSIPTAAAHFGLNENAFRQLLHRARLSLRRRVDGLLCSAPVLWLQRVVLRDGGTPTSLAGLPAGATSVAALVALLLVVPSAVSSGADAEDRDTAHRAFAVVEAEPAAAFPSDRHTAGSDLQHQEQVAEVVRSETPLEAAQAKPAAPTVPEVGVRGVPVRVHQQAPENPDVHYGARVEAPSGHVEEVGVKSHESPAEPVHELACDVAAVTPPTYCERSEASD